jgi:hypothetical protein
MHRSLHGPETEPYALLLEQFLADHLGVAVMLIELLLQPLAVFVQLTAEAGAFVGLPLSQGCIAANGVE